MRQAKRRPRGVRRCVEPAAVVSAPPGLADTLTNDWTNAARFYARFGVTEAMLRHGVPPMSLGEANWTH
jgi:hypothetical protein